MNLGRAGDTNIQIIAEDIIEITLSAWPGEQGMPCPPLLIPQMWDEMWVAGALLGRLFREIGSKGNPAWENAIVPETACSHGTDFQGGGGGGV